MAIDAQGGDETVHKAFRKNLRVVVNANLDTIIGLHSWVGPFINHQSVIVLFPQAKKAKKDEVAADACTTTIHFSKP